MSISSKPPVTWQDYANLWGNDPAYKAQYEIIKPTLKALGIEPQDITDTCSCDNEDHTTPKKKGAGHGYDSGYVGGDEDEPYVPYANGAEKPRDAVPSSFPDRPGPAGGKWDDLIEKYAAKYGVDPNVIKAIMAKESQGDPSLVSWAGAAGLMQVKPETASELLGRPVTMEELLNNPELNIEVGVKYFAKMLEAKGGNLEDALGAYNQGPNANWRSINESVDYVDKIMSALRNGTLPTWG